MKILPMRGDSKKISFLKEVRMMLYSFGDVNTPRADTTETLHNYLIDYLHILLTNTHAMARIKGKTKTEDLMYFLKRDRRAYSRVKFLLITNEEIKEQRKILVCNEYENDM
ncbi:transcription initiation factor TFIID subunit 13 [Pancytospora philotis]|nr:transcription initiation factor TFIID subunit 13 [Pancytospora philotis]